MDRPEQTLSAVLDAGELLLTSGAEAARVGSNGTDGRRSGDHADTPHPAARNRYALH